MPAPRAARRRVEFTNAPAVDVVPWIEEPLHTALLVNEHNTHTRVYSAALKPGDVTLFHSHAANTAYVVVSPPGSAIVINEVVKQGAAGPEPPAELSFGSGDCFVFPCADGAPLVHRLKVPAGQANGGPHFVGVEVLEAGGGGGATATASDFPAPFVSAGVAERWCFILRITLASGQSVELPGPATPCVAVVVRPGAVAGAGPLASLAGKPPGAIAFWSGEGEAWSATNEGGAEFEAALVVWTGV